MRLVSTAYDAEVAGSTYGDTLEVNAWRGGTLLAAALDVTGWSLAWDTGRQVQGQGSFTVADPEGALSPWGLADALAPGGSRLQVTWVSGLTGARIPLGWWRVRKVDPSESWRFVSTGTPTVHRAPGGGLVQVDADEDTASIVLARMDAEVVTATTVLAEIRRLLRDICPVAVLPGVTDRATPTALVYNESRMDAVEDLLVTIDATHRMAGDGTLEILPEAGVGPVWTLAGGDEGVLVSVDRSLSDDAIYNAVISTGESGTGQPLVGRAYLSAGPLAWGGPFGRVPMFHKSIATTPEGVQAAAETMLANRQTTGEVDLAVTCLTHPGLQPHDRVTVLAPTVTGDATITGAVVAMTLASIGSGSGVTPAKSMRLRVRVATTDLETIAARVRRE